MVLSNIKLCDFRDGGPLVVLNCYVVAMLTVCRKALTSDAIASVQQEHKSTKDSSLMCTLHSRSKNKRNFADRLIAYLLMHSLFHRSWKDSESFPII